MRLRETIAERFRAERETAETANRKILSSIEYARRIQQAILPDAAARDALFGPHFVLYRPRDVVSGDFFWGHRAGESRFAAVVDCTGHGVPGAFMSLIAHALLQRIVAEENIHDPGAILARLHTRVREALRQDQPDHDNQDGMDIALVRIDPDRVLFAGARRPLYWTLPPLRSDSPAEFGEIKGERASLGGGRHEKHALTFTTHVVPRRPGLRLHLCSDGFADQPNHLRRPFDAGPLRSLLQETAALPPRVQLAALEHALDTHRGGAEQRDDITVLGLALD